MLLPFFFVSTRFKNCLKEINNNNNYHEFIVVLCLTVTSFQLFKSCELVAAVLSPFHSFRKPEVKSDSSRSFHARCLSASLWSC